MKVGDLVRHAVHSGALVIIIEINHAFGSVKVMWANNSWGTEWDLSENVEVIEKNEVFS